MWDDGQEEVKWRLKDSGWASRGADGKFTEVIKMGTIEGRKIILNFINNCKLIYHIIFFNG